MTCEGDAGLDVTYHYHEQREEEYSVLLVTFHVETRGTDHRSS